MKLEGLQPERVLYYFEKLTEIPRCSKNEENVSNFLVETAKEMGLEAHQDKALNVVIKKPASPGYEDRKTVILQGHMDMVCEKYDDFEFDFSKDPIPFEVEDDFIISKNTTLGADNGIAVAISLAILEDKTLKHGPLMALITTDEETGLTGAVMLDSQMVGNADYLINIDSESEGMAIVSCAGGETVHMSLPVETKDCPAGLTGYELSISGLLGGHSGLEIHVGRANSNKLAFRFLDRVERELGLNIAKFNGGSKHNAIPRATKVQFMAKDGVSESLNRILEEENALFKNELSFKDEDVLLELKEISLSRAYTNDFTRKLIDLGILMPHGPQTMSGSIEGLVESSCNFAIVESSEDMVNFTVSIRSSVDSLKVEIANRLDALSRVFGTNIHTDSKYPAWQFQKDSPLRDALVEEYKKQTGKEMEIKALHAGLECGLFKETLGDLDMVSIGANLYGVHAPGEKVSISSLNRTYKLLVGLLKNI